MSDTEYIEFKLIMLKRYNHTKKRLKERFKMYLSVDGYYNIINSILNNESVILDKNKYVEFHCVYYKNCNIIFVYEPKTQSIRTALSLEYFK